MNKNIRFIYLALLLLTVSFYSCDPDDPGLGGESSVSGKVVHHDDPIPNALVFIKFGAKEFPGSDSTVYDLSVIADQNGDYSITGLKKGDYYLYGTGFDAAINQAVFGGIPISLGKKEDLSSDLPVTED